MGNPSAIKVQRISGIYKLKMGKHYAFRFKLLEDDGKYPTGHVLLHVNRLDHEFPGGSTFEPEQLLELFGTTEFLDTPLNWKKSPKFFQWLSAWMDMYGYYAFDEIFPE